MIDTQPIHVFAPGLSEVKDPSAGYFAAVRLEEFSAESLAATASYSRKDFYKISLVTGNTSYFYQGTEYRLNGNEWVLVFTNREVPYRWEVHEGICHGYACMFTEDFLPLHTHLRPADWPVFNGNAQSVFKLNPSDEALFTGLFQKMLDEQTSTYVHKYDLLFLYVLECIHGALKQQPEPENKSSTAATRLANSFKSLLAGQFPLAYPYQQVYLRTPQQFAEKLAIHTNSLNRALKEATGKTTTQLINERLMMEARALLVHSNWSISQISNSLGFEEATHFARAFRAYSGQSPSSLR
ncbi:helix-turn-helix protein [Arcticibacter tournemirensis]|uniref:Helix-turn-helix transcriptional regulator n=1 Tax=Arcticibacter tournemirensis TaxID=699437 RepID=A0A5M9GLT6_9SPHI|nr:AraC family transcriptional regulator [Arcticibacter tournemirensis]KAA8475672.1 helix-turn-helix transcriptional regulator [Arcticibacter tournemirensis]TQM50785.1 helix-turn-helix protein [Arcticibacter tournemirensis]